MIKHRLPVLHIFRNSNWLPVQKKLSAWTIQLAYFFSVKWIQTYWFDENFILKNIMDMVFSLNMLAGSMMDKMQFLSWLSSFKRKCANFILLSLPLSLSLGIKTLTFDHWNQNSVINRKYQILTRYEATPLLSLLSKVNPNYEQWNNENG